MIMMMMVMSSSFWGNNLSLVFGVNGVVVDDVVMSSFSLFWGSKFKSYLWC